MTKYILTRIGQSLLVLWATFTVSFVLLQSMPGDAILIKFQSPDYGLSPEQLADIRAAYGADGSILQQYVHTVWSFLSGNFGYSLQAGVSVSSQLAVSLPSTLLLAGFSFLLAAILAVVIAILANLSGFGWLRGFMLSLPSLFISVPTFWLGIMFIQIFSFRLRLVPVIDPGPWQGLILPILTVAIPISAPLAQIILRNIDEVLTRPFISVARAKGASHGQILWRHVAKNTLLPVLTVAGLLFGELIAGAVVTETVFGLNGIGNLTKQAVDAQDVAVLQAIVVISAAAFVTINLIVDLLYPILDPRLKTRLGAN
ncbi:binding protein-protein-dependent transport system inner membrane component [Rhizobium freirei PRF 81]|uniref:Binding protein-protein-dependent transport system inner membrane component n=1 Tax=Rhizobium freirei PRF 81 TaxID=363754 RepID=N6UAX3_9HYPH|nr:ABC transporter permease [Rhizobium freirei]ENN89664.1 binding protein-protein-dependent transport system inner membrane component [Rhizobium freirei PRF 81]